MKFKFQTVAAKKAKGGYFILPHLVDLLGMLYKFTIVILEMVYTSLKCAACLEITSLSRRRDIARLTPVHHNQGPPQPKMQFIPIPHPITNPIPEPTLTLSHVTKPTTGWEDAASSLSRPVCICQNFAKYWSIFRILSMALSGQLAIKLLSPWKKWLEWHQLVLMAIWCRLNGKFVAGLTGLVPGHLTWSHFLQLILLLLCFGWCNFEILYFAR